MRAVVQRVASASVTIDAAVTATIGPGLLVLLGVQRDDGAEDARWLAQKIAALRIFGDDAGRMNRSLLDREPASREILVVSQFTLLASTSRGTRPSFNDAAPPAQAIPLYELFTAELRGILGHDVKTGTFGALMQVALVNDGPVTLILDTRARD